MPDIPALENSPYSGLQMPKTTYNPSYNPFDTSSSLPSYTRQDTKGWDKFYEGLEHQSGSTSSFSYPDDGDYFVEQPKEEVAPSLYGQAGESASLETASQHYQYKGHYILTSVKSGLMVIDQHRAHVRILYDRYLSQIASRQGASQGMLFPDIVQVSASEIPVLQSIMDDLSYLGFELTDLGGGSYAINGVPAGIEGLRPTELVQNMVQTAIEKGCKVKEEVQSLLALSLAKAAAIVQGQVLSNEEMNHLVDELLTSVSPTYTPEKLLWLLFKKKN